MSDWETGKPPPGEIVEVEDPENEGVILRVRAIWGDRNKGVTPHWETEDRSTLYYPYAFQRWRKIDRLASLLDKPIV